MQLVFKKGLKDPRICDLEGEKSKEERNGMQAGRVP